MFFESWWSLVRVVIITVAMYLSLVLMLRVSGKHALSQFSMHDFVLAVAVGNVVANTILVEQVTLTMGVLTMILLLGMQVGLSVLTLSSRRFRAILQSPPRLVVYKGKILEKALKEEDLLPSEIRQQVRRSGIGRLEDVEAVVLEANGSLSIISKGQQLSSSCFGDVRTEEEEAGQVLKQAE